MSYYSLSWDERRLLDHQIESRLLKDLQNSDLKAFYEYFSNEDTYVRKSAYKAIGKIYLKDRNLLKPILSCLNILLESKDPKIRQTAINTAGEMGKVTFAPIQKYLDKALFDMHHSVRNAVIGSMKKISEVNPIPLLSWAKIYLHHEDKEIRREICHGIELRGRTHPQDILPLLKKLEFDKTSRVRKTLVHVIGQISYKKACLETVLKDLKNWENKELVKEALIEIIDVHDRYKNFSYLTQEEAKNLIDIKKWTLDNSSKTSL